MFLRALQSLVLSLVIVPFAAFAIENKSELDASVAVAAVQFGIEKSAVQKNGQLLWGACEVTQNLSGDALALSLKSLAGETYQIRLSKSGVVQSIEHDDENGTQGLTLKWNAGTPDEVGIDMTTVIDEDLKFLSKSIRITQGKRKVTCKTETAERALTTLVSEFPRPQKGTDGSTFYFLDDCGITTKWLDSNQKLMSFEVSSDSTDNKVQMKLSLDSTVDTVIESNGKAGSLTQVWQHKPMNSLRIEFKPKSPLRNLVIYNAGGDFNSISCGYQNNLTDPSSLTPL